MSEKVFTQKRWSLADLYPTIDGPEMKRDFAALEEKVAAFEKMRPQLTDSIPLAAFMDVIHALEGIYTLAMKLGAYPELLFTEDTQSQVAMSLMGRVQQVTADVENRTLFFSLWWKELNDENAARLMKDSGDYRYWLEEMRHFKPHTLSEAEEKVINIKNVTGVNALNTLYDTLTNRYTFKVEVDGEMKEMTRGELMMYVREADPDLRARAYQELYRVFGSDGAILGQMYQTIARDWHNEEVDMRRYTSPISARNLGNDLPDEVIDTLLKVCEENTGTFQRFFKLKARLIGMKKLRRYDIYAPVAKSDKRYDFKAAQEKVFDSFRQFDPRFETLAKRVFNDDHLDSEVRKGKQNGAFCATILPSLTPWVLLNYQGKADDVSTMAHELGHAIHSMLAEQHTLFTQGACLPLAETASTFGEMMLVDRLLSEESDEGVRRDLLFRQIDDAYATIQRQAFFALFEKKAHQMVMDGASVDEMAAAYLENLKEQFGDAVEISDEFKWEWVSIPHIYHTPFYVYAYAFGQLLVFALYKQFKAEGDSFKPRYIKLLSAGGSEAPMQVLRDAGIDVSQAAFWQGGFDVISGLVDQLEKITK
ncbi:MAG: M3 family oligoendopeptidase [Anaerolineaceae bacterium]|nr:M3 family oligoendopeptidase [Anaerolineaceae bacterium]